MTPDISAPWLPNAYLTQASTSAIAATLWPSTYEMELGATATTYWSQSNAFLGLLSVSLYTYADRLVEPNDWNTLGRYPFSTKIRIENEGEPAPLQPVAFEPVQPYILPSYSPALSSHSRHTSRSVSNESDHAEEHVPPSPMESRSPTVAYESIPSQAGLAKLSNGQWQCAYCLKQFKRRDRGQAHVNVHINARPYRCDGSCGNPVW